MLVVCVCVCVCVSVVGVVAAVLAGEPVSLLSGASTPSSPKTQLGPASLKLMPWRWAANLEEKNWDDDGPWVFLFQRIAASDSSSPSHHGLVSGAFVSLSPLGGPAGTV